MYTNTALFTKVLKDIIREEGLNNKSVTKKSYTLISDEDFKKLSSKIDYLTTLVEELLVSDDDFDDDDFDEEDFDEEDFDEDLEDEDEETSDDETEDENEGCKCVFDSLLDYLEKRLRRIPEDEDENYQDGYFRAILDVENFFLKSL